MSDLFMILGFLFAGYSIVANDSIQTLGTFLSSNNKRPWWILWIWISGIMIATITWGWIANGGDPAFGRLSVKGIDFPPTFTWHYVIPPITLVILTRLGIPVSTTFLVITAFSALTAMQMGESAKDSWVILTKMLKKSASGYALAFAIGFAVYWAVIATKEKFFIATAKDDTPHRGWTIFQWFSTGFLWCMWLVQDLANIFVYLPRKVDGTTIFLSLLALTALQGYIIRERGGRIQKIVTEKTNTLDVRSATFIDFFYGLVLLFFKVDYIPKLFAAMGLAVPWPEKMPMSTTWVFLGLLAGRELGLTLRLNHRKMKKTRRIIFNDIGKAAVGVVVGIVIAIALPALAAIGS